VVIHPGEPSPLHADDDLAGAGQSGIDDGQLVFEGMIGASKMGRTAPS
jgi:hypothetical protein